MAQLVKTLVGLPIHVAMVKGLNRYLAACQPRASFLCKRPSYAAATSILSHFVSFLGDVNRRDEPDSPDSVIRMRALAQRRSRRMWRRAVNGEKRDGGIRAKSGRSNGA